MAFHIILFQSFMSFCACVAFSVVFNAPKKELVYCGISGFLGWFFYGQAPSTLYHIPGIMPMVPGTVVYNTMATALGGMILETYSNILLGLKLAGAIGAGSILILALPYSFFEIIPRRKKKVKA